MASNAEHDAAPLASAQPVIWFVERPVGTVFVRPPRADDDVAPELAPVGRDD